MDQTGSVSYIPYIGVVLLMPDRPDVIARFDAVATGIVPLDVMGSGDNADRGHLQLAEYEPEVVYLGKLDRPSLISGWDIPKSLDRVAAITNNIGVQANAMSTRASNDDEPQLVLVHDPKDPTGREKSPGAFGQFVVDSTTEVLLGRMENIARLVGVLSLLVALPLLWMAWVLGANLTGLLMLNERRTLGLMRLRGISGQAMGRALQVAIVTGGTVGGALGLLVGSILPLMIYERGKLPMDVLTQPSQLLLYGGFLLISILLALIVSRGLVKYAMTISPLEASRRVSESETANMKLSFGVLQALALILGSYVLFGWTFDFSASARYDSNVVRTIDRLLDFVGLPLFLYGLATMIASRRERIQRVMTPIVTPIGGRLSRFASRHISVKPHRAMAFLLIVALMSGVSLYPTITSPSFSDKAIRGAQVQLGTDWQLLYNAPDLTDVANLRGDAGAQLRALTPQIERLSASLKGVQGVRSVTWMVESVLPSFYLPGYGLKGVPLYLLGSSNAYMQDVYYEPEVGMTADFAHIMSRVRAGDTASSLPVSEFWRLNETTPVLLGMDSERRAISLPSAGTARVPARDTASIRDRPARLRAGASRLPESPVQQQCVSRRRIGQCRDCQAAAVDSARDHAGVDRGYPGFRRVQTGAGARIAVPAARTARSRARDQQGRHRHVHRAGAGEHEDLPGGRPAPRAHRHFGDRDGQSRGGPPDARAAQNPRRFAARSVAVHCRHAAVTGAGRSRARNLRRRPRRVRAGELRLEAERNPHSRPVAADTPRRVDADRRCAVAADKPADWRRVDVQLVCLPAHGKRERP